MTCVTITWDIEIENQCNDNGDDLNKDDRIVSKNFIKNIRKMKKMK